MNIENRNDAALKQNICCGLILPLSIELKETNRWKFVLNFVGALNRFSSMGLRLISKKQSTADHQIFLKEAKS